MDPLSMLEHYSSQAARYCTNLNGKIALDKSMAPNRGGLASVYPGTLRQEAAENKVAIRVYFAPPGDEDILKRVLREIHLWSNLRHENVLRILGISTEFRDTISIISDWMAMGYAHSYVQNEENDPRPLLMDVSAGLQYLHIHDLGPIVHGDLNGWTVLVSDDRRALIAGFHCSTLASSTSRVDVDAPRGGAVQWMAPEILDNFNPSTASDVWAFGMTMLELFTRSIPFPDSHTIGQTMVRMVTGQLPTRPTEGSTCFRMTDAWWKVCLSCLQRDPSSRPTISEIHSRIMHIMRPAPLEEVCRRATKFSINLNGQIRINDGQFPKHGGSAFVHRGVLRREGEETMVAVKIFHSVPPSDMNALACILREVHIGSKLCHENIIRTLGISTEFGGAISIISGWMELGDAHTYVQQEQNDPRPLLRDIANGLHYLHTHELGPIFHGDLKGMNVLVSNDRRALLTDFGFSTLTKSSFSMNVIPPRGGSFSWMAPELLNDYVSSVAGDVWAFGMTILELFTRLMPFHECRHDANIMLRIIRRRLPDRPMEVSTCFRMTDAWWEICTLCWEQEPSSRPTASEILDKIEQIMGSFE